VPDAEQANCQNEPVTPASVAVYIAALTAELGQLARANGLDTLGYLLDMARLEADETVKASAEGEQWADPTASRRAS
jgi:hypothetical protein